MCAASAFDRIGAEFVRAGGAADPPGTVAYAPTVRNRTNTAPEPAISRQSKPWLLPPSGHGRPALMKALDLRSEAAICSDCEPIVPPAETGDRQGARRPCRGWS